SASMTFSRSSSTGTGGASAAGGAGAGSAGGWAGTAAGGGSGDNDGSGMRCGLFSMELLSRSRQLPRQRPDPLHHARQAVAAAQRQVLVQAELLEKRLDVEVQDGRGALAREDALQDGDQAADKVGVAVGEEVDGVRRPRPLAGDHVDGALAAVYAVGLGLRLRGQRRQFLAELDNVLVTLPPVAEVVEVFEQLVGRLLRGAGGRLRVGGRCPLGGRGLLPGPLLRA